MSVGLAELDADHQQLIRIINSLEAPAGVTASGMHQALVSLSRYAEFHFEREEKVMAACGYDGQSAHKQEHRTFSARIRSLAAELDREDPSLSKTNKKLVDYLTEWLRHHILIVDMAYRPVVEGNRNAQEAARNFRASEVWWSS